MDFNVLTLKEMLEDMPGVVGVTTDTEDFAVAEVTVRDSLLPEAYLSMMMKASGLEVQHDSSKGVVTMRGRQDRIIRHVSPKMVQH